MSTSLWWCHPIRTSFLEMALLSVRYHCSISEDTALCQKFHCSLSEMSLITLCHRCHSSLSQMSLLSVTDVIAHCQRCHCSLSEMSLLSVRDVTALCQKCYCSLSETSLLCQRYHCSLYRCCCTFLDMSKNNWDAFHNDYCFIFRWTVSLIYCHVVLSSVPSTRLKLHSVHMYTIITDSADGREDVHQQIKAFWLQDLDFPRWPTRQGGRPKRWLWHSHSFWVDSRLHRPRTHSAHHSRKHGRSFSFFLMWNSTNVA